jgi:uncharacterized protein YjdB
MRRWLIAAAAALGAIGVACYQDDVLHPASIASTKVLLTDDPFPFDSVSSVTIYVTRIEASARFDTIGAASWVEIAAPKKAFDLLTLQQGTTAFVGEGTIDAGEYAAIRMTIDVDKSSLKYLDGSDAVVHWPGQGEITLYALVEEPLAVSPAGTEIVIDFDVGRSFLYRLFGSRDFVFQTWLRAVNVAATGAIEGTVTRGDGAAPQPVQNANITVYDGESFSPYVVATGRTDAQGHYKIAFLRAGAYFVTFEQPDIPALAPIMVPVVSVSAGAVTPLSAELQLAGAGGEFLRVSGPPSVGVGGTIVLRAAVGDSNGNPLPSPTINWFSRDTAIALLLDSSYADTLQFVLGRREGSVWIVAQSGALLDSAWIQVVAQSSGNPVASVAVSPPSLNLVVGDSTFLHAELRDSAGNIITNRTISWFPADSSGVVDLLVTVGPTAVLKARLSGSTTIRAVSEGKTGSAIVAVQ